MAGHAGAAEGVVWQAGRGRKAGWRVGVPALLLLFSAAMAVCSPGFFDADEISHFLKARELWTHWRVVLDIWGRPACTGLYGLVAPLGISVTRLLAVLVTGLTAWGAVRLLREIQQRGIFSLMAGADRPGYFARNAEVWVWVLLYAQPLFLMNTFAVMTEMLLACAWVWAAVLLARGRWMWAGLLLGVAGWARPEGWFALAIWPLVLLAWQRLGRVPDDKAAPFPLRRFLAAGAIAALPMALWWLAGALAFASPRWMIDYFPWQARSQYGRTGALFLVSALVSLGVWMWLPVAIAAQRLWKTRAAPGIILLVLPVGCFYTLHGIMGSLGLMGAMSLPRYFVSVAPFLAVLAVLGLMLLEARTMRPRRLRRWVIGAAVLPGFVLAAAGQLPVSETTDMLRLDVATLSFARRVPPANRASALIALHPYVYYRLHMKMGTPAQLRVNSAEAIRTAPRGTIVITDGQLWPREGRPGPGELLAWGYRIDETTAREIQTVKPRFDVTTLFPTGGQVALWIKRR